MIKKCTGCGAILQDGDAKAIGYVNSLDMDLCQRCFKIRHYGDLTIDLRDSFKNADILEGIKSQEGIIVWIIDVMNVDFALDEAIIDALKGRRAIIIFNKFDLLSAATDISKYENYLITSIRERLKGIDVLDVLLVHKYDEHFKDLFLSSVKRCNEDTYIFIGHFNAGKSTVINKLVGKEVLLSSKYPSTTVAFNEMKHEGLRFIDTPGLLYDDHLATFFSSTEVKRYVLDHQIKPRVYQVYSPQSYVVEDLLAITLRPKERSTLVFHIDDRIDIHRTKAENLQDYLVKRNITKISNAKAHRHKSSKAVELVINGLGAFSIKGSGDITLHMSYPLGIKERERIL